MSILFPFYTRCCYCIYINYTGNEHRQCIAKFASSAVVLHFVSENDIDVLSVDLHRF